MAGLPPVSPSVLMPLARPDAVRLIPMNGGATVGRLTDDDRVIAARRPSTMAINPPPDSTGSGGARERSEVLVQARSFESLLVQSLIHELRDKGLTDGFFGGGVAGDVYGMMLDTHLAGALTESMSLGLAEQMTDQLQQDGAAKVSPLPDLPTEMLLVASGLASGLKIPPPGPIRR